MIAIIDYGSGNLRSIRRGLESHDLETIITPSVAEIEAADAVVLPGVGNASHTMDRLNQTGIADAIHRVVNAGKPFLGICVGMQVMFQDQEEGNAQGLGLLRGSVRKLTQSEKVPHIGWNVSRPIKAPLTLLGDFSPYVYFVHSFVAKPLDDDDVAAEATYGETFPSAVIRDNVWGTQFHPELSGQNGRAYLGLWAGSVRSYERQRGLVNR